MKVSKKYELFNLAYQISQISKQYFDIVPISAYDLKVHLNKTSIECNEIMQNNKKSVPKKERYLFDFDFGDIPKISKTQKNSD